MKRLARAEKPLLCYGVKMGFGFSDFFKNFIYKHWLALVLASVVGLIYLAPNVFFILSLGDDYRGIPMMKTPNEDFYLGRIREILDGYPGAASFVFFEYKNEPSLTPPIGEFFYAIPGFLLNASPVNILIASRFYLPFILFLLTYFLIHRLTASKETLSNKINAVSGALLVTLGYDLVDYRSLWGLITGVIEPSGFLIWARPVRPIIGVILLMTFLLFLWSALEKTSRRKIYMAGTAIFLALMFPSGFFDWGIAMSILAALILIYLFQKEYEKIKNLLIIIFSAVLLASPYLYSLWRSSSHEWYQDSVLRLGLFYTHYPLMNKLMLVVLVLYLILVSFSSFKYRKTGEGASYFQNWHWMSLAFILGSFLAYNQQIITGKTIWPYHFVQYTIPLAMIVFMVLFYNIIKIEWSRYLWVAGIFTLISASLLFGIYTQLGAYNRFYARYAGLQSYASLFDWFNEQEKDCVIHVGNTPDLAPNLEMLILAFTHCNIYNSATVYSLMPDERVYHNYFSTLFFNGVTAENIEKYMREHEDEVRGRLSSNWKSLYGVTEFPDFEDTKLKGRIENLPEDYRKFLSKNITDELNKYRLDYVLLAGPLDDKVIRYAPNLKIAFEKNDMVVYSFEKK